MVISLRVFLINLRSFTLCYLNSEKKGKIETTKRMRHKEKETKQSEIKNSEQKKTLYTLQHQQLINNNSNKGN